MPYKWETNKTKLPVGKDRRIKLTLEQREEIRRLYGTVSQRKLAKMFNVSRRLITFIGDPEKHIANLKAREKRGGSKVYYDTNKNTEAKREHRRYKQQIMMKESLL